MIPRSWIAGGMLTALVLSNAFTGQWAWRTAVDRTEARYAAELEELNGRLKRAAQKHAEATEAFLRERQAKETLQEELDDEAREDPDLDDNGLPTSSLRRLNAIR